MPSRLNPGTRDPIRALHYRGHSQRQAECTKGHRWGDGGAEGGPVLGPIHTCLCPHPAELCAAGGLSPQMTLGELGEEQRGHCPEALSPGQQQSCFCPRPCFQLPPGSLWASAATWLWLPAPSTPHQRHLLSGRENPSQKAAVPRFVGCGGPRGVSACTWPPSASRASVPHRLPCNVL